MVFDPVNELIRITMVKDSKHGEAEEDTASTVTDD